MKIYIDIKELMKESLLTSFYNWTDSLELVINRIMIQSIVNKQFIIADDDATGETKLLIG